MELSRKPYVIAKGTVAYLSQRGYYGYFYKDLDKEISFEVDMAGEELTDWKNEPGWKAILLKYPILDKYKERPCNVVWVKE